MYHAWYLDPVKIRECIGEIPNKFRFDLNNFRRNQDMPVLKSRLEVHGVPEPGRKGHSPVIRRPVRLHHEAFIALSVMDARRWLECLIHRW